MVFAVKKGLFASRTFSLLMATPAEKFKLKVSKLSKLSESIKHMPVFFSSRIWANHNLPLVMLASKDNNSIYVSHRNHCHSVFDVVSTVFLRTRTYIEINKFTSIPHCF